MPTPLSTWAHRARRWLRRVPVRARAAIIAAVIAMSGLTWQHHSHTTEVTTVGPLRPAVPAPPVAGDYGDQPNQEQRPAPTVAPAAASLDAAVVVAQRFADNFAAPNNNRDDWLARIGPDVTTQLREQYQLTDIRTVTRAAVTAVAGPLDALPGAAAFRASYSDGSQIQMHLELELDGWKIVNVVPVH